MLKLLSFSLLFALNVSLLSGCTEPNPDYDPDFVPPCKLGSVQCSDDLSSIMACQVTEDDTREFITTRTCWESTLCSDGFCGSDAADTCSVNAECDAGLTCTALPMSRNDLGTFCITSPNPLGLEGGKACSNASQCISGYCFRSTCFTPCNDINDCPFDSECVELNVTIDGIQGKINGCAIPAD